MHAEQFRRRRGGGDKQRRVDDDGDLVHALQHRPGAVGEFERRLDAGAVAGAQRQQHESRQSTAQKRPDRQGDGRQLRRVHVSSVGWAEGGA